jgi:hypothetical protein
MQEIEDLDELERKTPRTLVREPFSFLKILRTLPRSMIMLDRNVVVIQPKKPHVLLMGYLVGLCGVVGWGMGGAVVYMVLRHSNGAFAGNDFFHWIALAFFIILVSAFLLEGLTFIIFGISILSGKCDDGRMIFDRRQGIILKKTAKKPDAPDLRIRDVAAVQVCSGVVHGETDTTVYELNLVLFHPPGNRIRVNGRSDESAIRYDAEQLAAFLDVPLWGR